LRGQRRAAVLVVIATALTMTVTGRAYAEFPGGLVGGSLGAMAGPGVSSGAAAWGENTYGQHGDGREGNGADTKVTRKW
jgi:hypothetical protein